MLNEMDIKAALIDKLLEKGALENAVLINEMVIANWNRRADLAVANGRLYAYEIKSDLDTLDRLEGQVYAYLDRFDKVTVVTTPKFVLSVASQMPDQVEIWEASRQNQSVILRMARRGRTKDITSRRMLCGFLLKTELLSLLRKHGIGASVSTPREALIPLMQGVSVKDLRPYVLDCLKNRYRLTFETFIEQRGVKTELHDFDNLSRSKLILKQWESRAGEGLVVNDLKRGNYWPLDLDALALKYGVIPDKMPQAVLLRTPRAS